MTTPPRGRADYLELGDWNAVCSMCGRKRKSSSLVRNWQGMWRCPEHNEARHPQDFVRGVQDVQTPPWTQPMPADTFVAFCTPNGKTSIAGFAVAGCWIAGWIDPAFDPSVST